MPEKDPPEKSRYSLMPSGVTDPGEHLKQIRTRAIQRVTLQTKELVANRDAALSQLERYLANISEGPAAAAADRAINNEQYVLNVLDLIQRIEDVMQKLTFILNLFGVAYPQNDSIGIPTSDTTNINRLRTNLGVALKHLGSINVDPNRTREDLGLLAPDHELISHIGEMNDRLAKSTNHSRDVIAIMDSLNAYLQGLIGATHLGVAYNVVTTREQLDRFDTKAAVMQVASDDLDDLFMMESAGSDAGEFFNLLRELEFTLANCTVRMTSIHRKNAVWLMTRVKLQTLQTITRNAQRRVEQTEQQISALQEEFMREPGWMERTGSRIFGKKADTEKPTATDIKLKRQELERNKQTLTLLRKILHIRIRQEQR